MNTNNPEVKEVIKKAFPGYNGRHITVELFYPMSLASYWSGGYRDYFAVVSLDPNQQNIASVPENASGFSAPEQYLETLPLNCALIRWHRGPHDSVSVFVNQDNLAKMLPGAMEITLPEKIVLAATRGYKSSYAGRKDNRFYEANSYTGISQEMWQKAKESCISKGLLNKAGAITDDGRNAIGSYNISNITAEEKAILKQG